MHCPSSRLVLAACGALVAFCLLACSGTQKALTEAAKRQTRQTELTKIGVAMHAYHEANKTLPADEQTFIAWLRESKPEVVSLVEKGPYTILYAPVDLVQAAVQGFDSSKVVMGYENEAGLDGQRLVLFANTTVDLVPEADFKAKPRLNAWKK
jgi:hypothetical protein